MYDKSQSYTLSVSFYRRYNRYNYKSVSNLETDIWVVSFLELNSMTKDLILFLYAISISAMRRLHMEYRSPNWYNIAGFNIPFVEGCNYNDAIDNSFLLTKLKLSRGARMLSLSSHLKLSAVLRGSSWRYIMFSV